MGKSVNVSSCIEMRRVSSETEADSVDKDGLPTSVCVSLPAPPPSVPGIQSRTAVTKVKTGPESLLCLAAIVHCAVSNLKCAVSIVQKCV